jgi:hypothetical protein
MLAYLDRQEEDITSCINGDEVKDGKESAFERFRASMRTVEQKRRRPVAEAVQLRRSAYR